MGIADFIGYFFSYRRKVYALRRKYDSIREKADKQPAAKRIEVLRILDQVEPTLAMIEEHNLSGYDRSKLSGSVMQGIRNAESLLKKNNGRRGQADRNLPSSSKNLYN